MRYIQYIAPIDHIRGSLCPRQELTYATDTQRAWDAESETISPDTYQPILIASRKRKTGLRYYCVRGRQTTRFSTLNRGNLAAFGAACSKYYTIMRRSKLANDLQQIWHNNGVKVTFREYIIDAFRDMYFKKHPFVDFDDGENAIRCVNEFAGGDGQPAPLEDDIVQKFGLYLSA